MADRYWVGGTGNWDATTTTNWSATSGGAGGASAPTSADNVIFNTLSNATLYTVTIGTNAVCEDLTAAGPLTGNVTFSLGATARLDPYGSMTLPATGLTWTGVSGCLVTFRATTTGKTLTTNGVTLIFTNITFNGVGGEWTLGSALTNTGNIGINIANGTFNTGNFNLTMGGVIVNTVGTQVINLGSSTLTLSATSPITFSQTAGLTFNAGTSQINCSIASPNFSGGGQTFYNVSFTLNAAGTPAILNSNTFNDLNFTSKSSTGVRIFTIHDNQTVNGTLTLGAANTSIRRIQIQSSVIGTQRTITLNGTLATLADVDFRDIATAGSAGTWTGTRLGNGLGNSGITFPAAKDVYFNLVAGASWAQTCWALSSGGAVDTNNFPLAQDKAIIENTGLNTSATVSVDAAWWIGEIDLSTRSNAMTLGNGTQIPLIYKNVTLSSAVTMTGTGVWTFSGQGTTQILDTNTATFVPPITINSATGTLQLAEDATCSATVTLTSGTLSLNNFNLTCNVFSSTNTNTRVIAFGTGNITTTGSGVVWTTAAVTNFSYTGTPTVNISNNSATASTVTTGAMTEAQSLNFNYTVGTYTLTESNNNVYRSVNFTGFAGTSAAAARTVFGNYTLSTGMTLSASASALTFAATSGTQQITTNGVALDNPITQNGVGGTVQLQDNLTMGSTRTYTLGNGALNINGKTVSVGLFSSTGALVRSIAFNGGTMDVSGATFTASGTNLTTSGTGIINMTSASSKTFAGGGFAYPTLNQGGLGTLIITGANTFKNITNSVQPCTITFPASTTTTVNDFQVSGTSGNLVSLNSSTLGTKFTMNYVTL